VPVVFPLAWGAAGTDEAAAVDATLRAAAPSKAPRTERVLMPMLNTCRTLPGPFRRTRGRVTHERAADLAVVPDRRGSLRRPRHRLTVDSGH
jgi:hypothetical protein